MIIFFQIIGLILCTVLSAWGYRFGGSKNGQRWVREVAVGISEILVLTILFGWNWWSLLIMATVWAMTTYFKKKGTDAKWYHWLLVGIVFALIPLPQVIAESIHHVYLWKGFLIRSVFIIPFTCLWCTFTGDVQWSEGVRGGIQTLTLVLLKIFK